MNGTYKVSLLDLGSLTAASIDTVQEGSASDGKILEVNQVAAYFAYTNRVALGLRVILGGKTHTQQMEIPFFETLIPESARKEF